MPDIIQRLRDTCQQNPAAVFDKLQEMFQQYDEGLIKVLPCKVGDKIYCIDPYKKQIVEDHVANVTIEYDFEDGFYGEFSGYGHISYRKPFSEIGKTVFLAPEAAEKAKELQLKS